MIWTTPTAMTTREAFRFCARRALKAHRAGQTSAARFWLDRCETFAAQAKKGTCKGMMRVV